MVGLYLDWSADEEESGGLELACEGVCSMFRAVDGCKLECSTFDAVNDAEAWRSSRAIGGLTLKLMCLFRVSSGDSSRNADY